MIPKASKHVGRNISRIRELLRLKQEYLAAELGVSQQAISKMEQNEAVEHRVLERVANVLGVSPEVVENFSDEDVFHYFKTLNTREPADLQNDYRPNGLDKLIEAYEENRKLYERLLACEREKAELLQQHRLQFKCETSSAQTGGQIGRNCTSL